MNDFGLGEHNLHAIIDVLSSVKKVQRALIYGSRAKGNYRSNSDIDIMVEGECLTIADLSMIDVRLDDLLLPWQIDLCARNRVGNQALLDEVEKWGVVVYQRSTNSVDENV